MSRTVLKTPTSRCRAGLGRVEITPPVGIYHRFWGAARHDRAEGVHRPLYASALALEPLDATDGNENRQILVAVDHCLFRPAEMEQILAETARFIELDPRQIVFTFSHTHSGGNLVRSRAELPGGELIGPYLDSLPEKIAAACGEAIGSRQTSVLTYASAVCVMGHNRDFRDDEHEIYVCGLNPERNMELPVQVVRVSGENGRLLSTVVSYPCHPTTLAWDNTLISPDYVGSLRETIEQATNAPCLFLLAPCGDIGPRHGFVGDPKVADGNGRQLAHAALSALESMPPAENDYHYTGPVISGATIGYWEYQPQDESRASRTSIFRRRCWTVPVPYRPGLPTVEETQQQLERHLQEESTAGEQGRDARALAERCRRTLERIQPLPAGESYPYAVSLSQLGDAFWVTVEGEPYFYLQEELQRRFPEIPIVAIALANGARCSYLPRREDYEKPLYQVSIALLEPGSLERITEEIAEQIQFWLDAED